MTCYSVAVIDYCAEWTPCPNGFCKTKTLGYECICNKGWKGENCTEGRITHY